MSSYHIDSSSPSAPPWIEMSPGTTHLDYSELWGSWLKDGEQIVSAVWTISPSGELADAGHSIAGSGTTPTIWLTGGVAGKSYTVSCAITTNSVPARIDTRSFIVRCILR